MADTEFGVNHALAVKLWSKKLFQEVLKETWLSRFMGESDSNVIQVLNDTSKGAGDRVTYGLRVLLNGAGVEGDNTLEGNEEALSFYNDSFYINQLRHATRSNGKMSEQRVPYGVREESMNALKDWWADRIDTALFNQLAGNTGQTDTRYTGHNATIAPDASHTYFANGNSTEAAVASATASNVMKLKFLDYAKERIKLLSPSIRPIKVDGKDFYVCFLHPYQVTDLRTDASTAGNWFDIQKAALQGGKITDNPIFTGALGVYNGIILHESTRIPSLVAGAYRSILCGAQAAVIGYGQGFSSGKMDWHEETFDHGNKLAVSSAKIWGAKKCVFNSADFGVFNIITSAQQHTT